MSIQDNFRLAMRRYIYSVSIMSNKDEKGDTNAITVSSVTSISMEPPSLLICINKSSRIHDTLKVGSQFCINLLNKHKQSFQIFALMKIVMKKDLAMRIGILIKFLTYLMLKQIYFAK